MEQTKTKKSSNGGYSLIELVVTVLISSVIMLAVIGFLTSGLRHFRNVNNEAVLQIESQVADLFITELFQEAQDYRVMDHTTYAKSAEKGITYAVKISREGTTGVLALVKDELWYAEVTDDTDAAMLDELVDKGKAGAFLTKHVSIFNLMGACDTYTKASTGTNGLVMITLKFAVDNKSYSSNMLISLRNTKTN